MKSILGLIVMTSPLFLIVLWVPLCIALAVWVGRKFIRTGLLVKISICSLIFLILLILPIADEIAGRIYFNHLCETEAGVKVYKTIELPAKYWDDEGKPTFYKGANNNDVPSYAFEKLGIEITAKRNHSQRWFHVNQSGTIYISKKTGLKLSEVVRFGYGEGWIVREMTPHNSSITCGIADSYDDLIRQQFIPASKKGEF